jgi:hypothetical protein
MKLVGAGGEPVDFARTIVSHGVAELAPNDLKLEEQMLETTLPVPGGARSVVLSESGGKLQIDAVAGRVGVRARDSLAATIAHMFRLDEDLSGFYVVACEDDELTWCAHGAGRMLRSPTVFDDVVKKGCTPIRMRRETHGHPYHADLDERRQCDRGGVEKGDFRLVGPLLSF